MPQDMSHTITVHDFLALGSASTARTALRFEQGRDLAFAHSSSYRWVTPQSTIDPSVFTLCRDRIFQYRFGPPRVESTMNPIATIPEWGQPSHPDDPDHLRLNDLQEFESTDFQISLTRPRAGSSRHGKRPQDSDSNRPAKRPRFENASLLDLIPQPHFIPAPAARFQPVDTTKIPHYPKAVPSPVAPYDTAAVNELLSGRYRRGAWLIPVRGNLPWDGTSAAVILEDTQVTSRSPSPCLPVSTAQPSAVTWSPDALHHLWTFLGSLQQAKHLGPLSLSFHAAPADTLSTGDTVSEPVWESNHPYYPQRSMEYTTGTSDDFAMAICKAQLEGIDYIKVYHDIPYSLSLRNILDAYQYSPVNGEAASRSGANDRKIRILKGARLVFMDEHSKAAFLM